VFVVAVKADPIRSLEDVSFEPGPGVTAITGPNGAGKTNLLETLYFGLTGRSFRTSDRRELIPFGSALARAEVVVEDGDGIRSVFLASVSRSEGRRHLLDGNAVDPATAARHRPYIAVFAPDRLQLVKGPPAERRAHLDAFISARWPGRSELRTNFGRALAQRNAMLSRIRAAQARVEDLAAWDRTLAGAAARLVEARSEACQALATPFAAAAGELGLAGEAGLRYMPRAAGGVKEILAGLIERHQADIELGRTGWGPHLDEIAIELDGRALRRYGSQGQQRAALLALLFAEREVLAETASTPPLLLLDDVMSELDPEHRELLGHRLGAGGQCLITAADRDVLPAVARAGGYRFRDGSLERV
jgi:DNA replication and repair protein RecF